MANSKYYDVAAVMQVIGAVFTNQTLLDLEEKYHFSDEDFDNEFHRILFGTIYNLHQLGAATVTIAAIEDYLGQRPNKYATYKVNKGAEYLAKLVEITQASAFNYYYNRMKKMTLMRMYHKAGMDLSAWYDVDNIMDVKKKQVQEEWLDSTSITEIADTIDSKIAEVRSKFIDDDEETFLQAGKGIKTLIDRLRENPEIGYPLYGRMVNSIHRGARLKKLYLRSAATGVGKTRAMIADACYIACNEIYNLSSNKWEPNNVSEPTLFIATEQDEEEVQTMMLAFLSAVDEDRIITSSCTPAEMERVLHAADIIENSPLYIKKLPNFSMQDIENTIKFAIREWKCRYIMFDYLHSSMKVLSEITGRASVAGLREDNVLFMMAVRLKDLCNQYNVFIQTATQLNAGYTNADIFDQNLLRGAKSIADKIDVGEIMLQTTPQDREALNPIITKLGIEMPSVKISVYKNRRGPFKDILLWCCARRDICRIDPIFATDYNYQLVEIPDTTIVIKE